MKVACYLRVSTNRQTVDNQIPEIQDYLTSHGIAAADVTYYSENESSWTAGHQTELARLKDDIRRGRRKFDLFLIWCFDRLCREGGFQMIKHYEFFLAHKIKVISIKEAWSDVPADFAPVMLAIFGYLAQMESKRRSARIKAGNARVLKEGKTKTGREIKQLGRPKGAKDKNGHRKKSGYYLRYANKVSEKITPDEMGESSLVTGKFQEVIIS